MSWKDKIDLEGLPQHVAIIMDGNGRWAKQRGKTRSFGHESGVKSVRETTEAAAEALRKSRREKPPNTTLPSLPIALPFIK